MDWTTAEQEVEEILRHLAELRRRLFDAGLCTMQPKPYQAWRALEDAERLLNYAKTMTGFAARPADRKE